MSTNFASVQKAANWIGNSDFIAEDNWADVKARIYRLVDVLGGAEPGSSCVEENVPEFVTQRGKYRLSVALGFEPITPYFEPLTEAESKAFRSTIEDVRRSMVSRNHESARRSFFIQSWRVFGKEGYPSIGYFHTDEAADFWEFFKTFQCPITSKTADSLIVEPLDVAGVQFELRTVIDRI